MNENHKSAKYLELANFVSEFQEELSKEEKDLNKISEMYSILKKQIREYYSSRDTELTVEEKELLEIIVKVITELPDDLEDDIDELVNFGTAPYVKDIDITKRENMLVKRLVAFIMKLPIEIFEENIEEVIDKCSANQTVLLRIFREISVEKIDKIINKIIVIVSRDNVIVFKRYFEYLLANNENAIINNNFAAQIFGFVNPILDDERLIEFKSIIEAEKKKYQYPDMSKYSKFIPQDYTQPFEQMDKDTFDEFCKDLEKIKILDGIIPEEYCDYLINRKLDESSHLNAELDRYFSILKRAFEDKIRYLFQKKDITNWPIFFRDNEIKRSKNIANVYWEDRNRIFVFEEEWLRNLSKSAVKIIEIIYHESRHLKQLELFYETDLSKIDGNIYNMIKEFIIKEEDREFYTLNYYRMYFEIDARYAGVIEGAEYLSYLGVSPEQEIDFEGYNSHLLENAKHVIKAINRRELRWASDKIDIDGNIISINDKLRGIIKEKPEFLEKFPALQIEFDKNGERKLTIDILKDASIQKNPNIQDIYTKIFECRNTVEPSAAIQTLEALAELLQSSETISDITLEYIKLIIENEILNSIFQCNRDDDKFNILVQRLKEFLENNIELGITDSINSKLQKFLEDGYMELGCKQDRILLDKAIGQILKRKIVSIEDFKKAIEDIKQLKEFEYFKAKYLLMMLPIELRQDALEVLKDYLPPEQLELLGEYVNFSGEKIEVKALSDIREEQTPEDINWGKKVILWFVDKIKFVGNGIKRILWDSDYGDR